MKVSCVKLVYLFLLFLLLSCAEEPPASNRPGGSPVPVEGFIVRTSTISNSLQASGTILPFEETALYPEISGRIVSLKIPEGREVSKGTLLAKIFDGDLQAELRKLEAQIAVARETGTRLEQLLKVNGIAQQEYDQAMLQLNLLNAQADIVKVQISRTEIRAPFNGVLGLKKVSEGAYVTPQNVISTIRSVKQLKLDFTIPEKYSSGINRGMDISFRVEGDTSTYQASIIATEESVEMNSRSLKIRALVKDPGERLLPGGFAEVLVPLGSRENAMMIPTQAIIPQARNKVVIVNKNGKAKFTPVTTGVREENRVEVTDGLQPGDTIAVTGILFLRPDAPLTFSKITQGTAE